MNKQKTSLLREIIESLIKDLPLGPIGLPLPQPQKMPWWGKVMAFLGFGSLSYFLVRWWLNQKKDHHKDATFYLGPKESGKSTIHDLLNGKPFNKDAPGTGTRCIVCGDKQHVFIDTGGDENTIKDNDSKIREQLTRMKPDYVVLLLTVDLNKIKWDELSKLNERKSIQVVDDLGVYIKYFVKTMEEKSQSDGWLDKHVFYNLNNGYENGRWACTILGTRKGTLKDRQVQEGLDKILRFLHDEGHLGRFRTLPCSGFELSDDRSRKDFLKWYENVFKKLHDEETT